MSLLTNVDTGEKISKYISLNITQEVIRTSQQLLSGDVYIQRIGAPIISYVITAYTNLHSKTALQSAEDTAALLKAETAHGIYYGRIIKLQFSDRMADDWFKVTITLAKEAVQ